MIDRLIGSGGPGRGVGGGRETPVAEARDRRATDLGGGGGGGGEASGSRERNFGGLLSLFPRKKRILFYELNEENSSSNRCSKGLSAFCY